MPELKISLLGYPTISLDGEQIHQDIPDKAIALLSFIALTGQTHRRDALAGMLWGNKREQRARNSLSIVLNKLRKHDVLEQILQVSRREVGIEHPDNLVCDVTQFSSLAARPEQQSLDQLESAAEFYGGAFLQGFRPNDDDGTRDFLAWAQQQQVRLEQLALDLFATLVSRYKETDNLPKAITYAQRILAVDPLMESAHRDLMLFLAQNGQSEQAIAQYQDCYQILESELGIEPDDATRLLYENILDSRNYGQAFKQANVALEESLHDKLPMRPYDVLFGRKEALAQLIDHLTATDTGCLTNLYGIGGLGKSSLAHMTVHHLIENKQISHLAWIEVESTSHLIEPLSTELLFESIIHRLIAVIPSIPVSAPTHAQRVRQVRKAFQSAPWLVVIDNIEIFDDDGTLSEQLFSLSNPSRFLIMSRTRLNAVRPIHALPLEPIDKEAALSCVRTRAASLGQADLSKAEDSLLNRLYELVGGHPQALLLFVQTAIYISPTEILGQFEQAEVQTINAFYDDIYQRIWDTQSTDAQQLLDAMRLSPVQGMPEEYLANICRLTRSNYWQAVRELNDAALLFKRTVDGETRQYVHSLTGSFLRSLDQPGSRSDSSAETRIEQISTACAWWQEKLGDMDGLAFEAAHPHLIKLIEMGLGRPDNWLESAELAAAYRLPVYTSELWRQWLPIYTLALAVTPGSNASLKMTLLSATGLLHELAFDSHSAIRHHNQALTIAENLEDPLEVARHNVNLARAYSWNHDFELAEQLIQTALNIVDELGATGLIATAAYGTKAEITNLLTHFDEVIPYCEKALALATNKNPHSAAFAYNTWANALFEMSQFEEAKTKYLQTLAIAQENHSTSNIVIAKIGLLDCHLVMKDVESAQAIVESHHFTQESALLAPHILAHVAELTGRFHLLTNNFSKAICYFEKAIPYWNEAKLRADLGKTFALLAFAHRNLGESEKFDDYRNRAAVIFADENVHTQWMSLRFPFISKNKKTKRADTDWHPPFEFA